MNVLLTCFDSVAKKQKGRTFFVWQQLFWDLNVMTQQIQTYVHLGPTQHNSDRPLVHFVTLDSTVPTPQILSNVILRKVFQ